MAHAVHAVQSKVKDGSIAPQDVTVHTLEQELYTQVCQNLEPTVLLHSPVHAFTWLSFKTPRCVKSDTNQVYYGTG